MIESVEALAERYGDREFVRWAADGSSTSYAELADLAGRWAALFAEAGVVEGDRVLLLLGNSKHFLGAYFGAHHLKALAVPVNTELRGESLRHPLALFEPRVVVVEEELVSVVEGAAAPGGFVVLVPSDDDLASATPIGAAPAGDSDPCLIMSTSGTTGPSKGSVWDHGTVEQWARGYRRHLRYTRDDRIYSCTPLFHANSLVAGVATAQLSGGAVVLGTRFSVSRFWGEVADSGATSANLLGSIVDLLLKDETLMRTRDRERSHLRTLLASSVSASAYRAVQERWGLTPISAYGLTDYGTVLSTTFGEPAPAGTVGKPIDEFEIRLVGPDDREVAAGQPGEALLRAREPWISPQGYFRMPEETVASRRNLWFHTGDLLRVDDDGWYFFAGRVKDSMRRRGENVSAHEVEGAVLTFPGVDDAAAYAVPADEGEDEIAVALVLRSATTSFDREAFFAHVAAELPYFAVPRYIRVLEALPRTPTQKVQKAVLRDQGVTADAWDRVAAGLEVARNPRR